MFSSGKNLFFIIMTIIVVSGIGGLISRELKADDTITFRKLKKQGIISGFGVKKGDPLAMLNRIPPIKNPRYVPIKKALYQHNTLCIGTKVENKWHFSPISVLNSHEIVRHQKGPSLCYCPLAGLAISLPGNMSVSGLLKYDTFVLFDDQAGDLILPFTQEICYREGDVVLSTVHLLSFAGIVNNFPNAMILDPASYVQRNPYGSYSKNNQQGLGHQKPGLQYHYDAKNQGFHPKEKVLIIGFNGQMQKAYPFEELGKSISPEGGHFEDHLGDQTVYIHFYPRYQWAYATNTENVTLNCAYSYIFSLYQHLPDIPVYKKL